MKKASVIITIILLASSALFAQKKHKHGSPHGGEVKTAGSDYHLEVTLKKGMMMVYLLDDNQKSLSIAGATASASIETADGKANTFILQSHNKEAFMLNLDKGTKYHSAVITVKIDGKVATAPFDLSKKTVNPGLATQDHNSSGHQH